MDAQHHNQPREANVFWAYYAGSDTLQTGYALCFNSDKGTATEYVEERLSEVEKPSSDNLEDFAGLVHPGSGGESGPCFIQLCRLGPVDARVDVSLVGDQVDRGDILAPQAGSYLLGPSLDAMAGPLRVGPVKVFQAATSDGLVLAQVDVNNFVECDMFGLSRSCMLDLDFHGPYASGNWTVTNTDGDGDSEEANAINDEQFGVLTLTTNDAEDDAEQHVWNAETFKLTSGNPLYCEFRAKLDAATESDMSIGLIATEDLSGGTLIPTDGVVFTKDDGDTHIDVCSSLDGSDDNTDEVATMDTDYHRYGIYFDGDSNVVFFVDGAEVGSATTVCGDEELAPHLMVLAGSGAARTLKTDYIRVCQLR